MRDWVWVAWHVKGAPTIEAFFEMPIRRRKLLIAEVKRRVEIHNDQFEE